MSSENSRTVELTVSRQSLIDNYAQWLAATKVVLPNEEVSNIQFNNLFGEPDADLIPIKVFINTPQTKEVQVKPDQVLN